ncbi:MAG: D-2-hydroxyacid dehydrogenase [Balneolaceae bacterium]
MSSSLKMVVLDGYTLNPGDLSWKTLQARGELTVYDRTPKEKVVPRSEGATVLFTNKTPITGEMMQQLPDLSYIGVMATGFDQVDVQAAREQGVTVSNAAGYSTDSVAQLVFALLLELCHHTRVHSDQVMDGAWCRSKDFSFWNHSLVELSGKTMGIIGFGTIGQRVADIATGFGMNLLGHRRTPDDQSARSNFRWASIDEILEASDVLSLHCPLVPETEGLISTDSLKRMQSSAFLINTSRGAVIDEPALRVALEEGEIAGAGLDVLSSEPPSTDHPLLGAPNCVMTPHFAWATVESRQRLMEIVVQNLDAFLKGEPENVVNG